MIWGVDESGCNPSKNRYLTPKILLKKRGSPKTRFGVDSPLFHLKGPFLNFRGMDKSIEESFEKKKKGVAHQKTGI